MTTSDQVIEEIRRSRCRLSQECGHDVSRYIDRISVFNQKYEEQVAKYRELHPQTPAAAS